MRKYILFLAMLFVFALSQNSMAGSFQVEGKKISPIKSADVPSVLKDWQKWSTDDVVLNNCHFSYNSAENKYCYYISSLDVRINKNNLTFVQKAKVLEDGYLLIAGSKELFPQKVLVNGVSKNIISKAGRPYVYLTKGEYKLEAMAKSKSEIRYLMVPENVGIVNVYKDGQKINNPTFSNGALRFEVVSTAKSDSDDINVFAYRKLKDSIPMSMQLNISINVTGKERIENLGKVVLDNFALVDIKSDLTSYVQKNGDLIVEVKSGFHTIDVFMRQVEESLDIVLNNSPVSQEVWVFENDESMRVVQAPEYLQSVQTTNMQIPSSWKSLPAYEVPFDTKVSLNAIDFSQKSNDKLTLSRHAKLSFDGTLYTIRDRISGEFTQDGRMSVSSPFKLYSSEINGKPIAITYDDTIKSEGVEIRKGYANITNILRVENNFSKISAAGYDKNFDDVNWELELAPGYKLFHVSGADKVYNSWVEDWNLLNVFLVVVLSVCFFYLFGRTQAIVALAVFVLLHSVFPGFKFISLILCGFLAIHRNISKDSKLYVFVTFVRYSLLGLLSIALFVFAVKHLRGAIYPNLALDNTSIFMGAISPKFLVVFYLYSILGYLFFKLCFGERFNIGAKIFGSLGLFLVAIISTSIAIWLTSFLLNIAGTNNYGYSANMRSISGAYDMYSGSGSSRYDSQVMYAEAMPISVAAPAEYKSAKQKVSKSMIKKLDINQYQNMNVAKNIAQTGVGFPEDNTYNITSKISIKGPVTEMDSFRIYLITPMMNLILAFVRVLLLMFMFYWLVDYKKVKPSLGEKGNSVMKRIFTLAVLGFMFISPMKANASEVVPSVEILKELANKTTREYVPSCLPECVSIPHATTSNIEDVVSIRLDLHSNDKLVVPLPLLRADGSGFAKLDKVLVNGKETEHLLRDNGALLTLVDKGISIVEVIYSVDENSDRFIMSSNIDITYMENKLVDFSLTENSTDAKSFQLGRKLKVDNSFSKLNIVKKNSKVVKADIETMFNVNRSFNIETLWMVNTQVVRSNNLSEASTIEIPLLSGEKVFESEGELSSNKIRISFAPYEREKSFSSMLPVDQDIKLKALDKVTNYYESWSFNIDNMWNFEYLGMKPIVSAGNLTTFKPRSGDSLQLSVYSPKNVDGYVVTFDKVDYNLSQVKNMTKFDLVLSFRASEAGLHSIKLPKGSDVTELRVGQNYYPVSMVSDDITIPVVQGRNNVTIEGNIPQKIELVTKFPELDLKAPAVNINESIQMPFSRLVLFTFGTAKGPMVLFWSMIPVWILLSLVLRRVTSAPMGAVSWFFLLVGLTQTHLFFMMLVVMWFIAMTIRDKFSDFFAKNFKKLYQIGLIGLSLLFTIALFRAIYNGLLSTGSMRIIGDGSYLGYDYISLKWYQDIIMGVLPSPVVISIPIYVYRGIMVVWSAWLAVSFVKWVKWGFSAFIKDKAW